MPDDKKNQQKGKTDVKEQRKPRQGRQKSGPATKTAPPVERKIEEPKVTVPQKPVYEDPGPEFYKNLKRETDEILKITEEANSKYRKKEIQSNWSKYEMPIESYEDIEEQENMGADYEQLIQMPLSIGGHFQFKHEKSWDAGTGPSPYDKYFEINMNNLANALCTIPFYERNNIPKDIFSESDMVTMNNRATKYKQKYYNDKSYTTPELEANDKVLNSFKEAFSDRDADDSDTKKEGGIEESNKEHESPVDFSVDSKPIDFKLENKVIDNLNTENRNVTLIQQDALAQKVKEVIDDIDDLILDDSSPPVKSEDERTSDKAEDRTPAEIAATIPPVHTEVETPSKSTEKCDIDTACKEKNINLGKGTKETIKAEAPKNPVIESPEDLEKWLDDFLDG